MTPVPTDPVHLAPDMQGPERGGSTGEAARTRTGAPHFPLLQRRWTSEQGLRSPPLPQPPAHLPQPGQSQIHTRPTRKRRHSGPPPLSFSDHGVAEVPQMPLSGGSRVAAPHVSLKFSHCTSKPLQLSGHEGTSSPRCQAVILLVPTGLLCPAPSLPRCGPQLSLWPIQNTRLVSRVCRGPAIMPRASHA